VKWRAIPGKENLIESDEDYTILQDTRYTPPRYTAFKRQYEKSRLKPGEKKRWAPPIVIGGFDDPDEARAACEKHLNPPAAA
jgi:hypothetical protein